jgi:hypothetical protein
MRDNVGRRGNEGRFFHTIVSTIAGTIVNTKAGTIAD